MKAIDLPAPLSGDAERRAIGMTRHMLERVAVDPAGVEMMRTQLEVGIVNLVPYKISNPVGLFRLEPGSRGLDEVREAVEANVAGPLFRAAESANAWRSPASSALQANRERKLKASLRATLHWPEQLGMNQRGTPAFEAVTAEHYRLSDLIHAREDAVHELRRDRIAAIERAASPTVGNWYELLADCEAAGEQAVTDAAVPVERDRVRG